MPKVPDAHLEARRLSIVEAACRVFSSKGMQSATMAEVAAEAGISAGAIYRYFSGKDDLARHCMSEAEKLMKSRWLTDREVGADPLGEVAALSRLTFELMAAPGERRNTILWLERLLEAARDNDQPGLEAMSEGHAEVLVGITRRLAAAKDAGQLPDGIEPRLLAEALMSFYWGSRLARIYDPGADTAGQLEQIIMTMEAGRP
jgi:AcrR family transcriptional regulator